MTRILRNTLSAAFLTSAAIMLAGCPTGTGATIPGATGVGGTTTAPGGTTTTPTTGGAANCTRTAPAATPDSGDSDLGAYAGQLLPNGYNNAYSSEAEVTAAIRKEDGGANWDCFQKFYPGATKVYMGKK